MNTKITSSHEITVADLRAFLSERGHKLPDQFDVCYGTAKTITDRVPSDKETILLWIDYKRVIDDAI